MAEFYPVVSTVNGKLVTGGPFPHNAQFVVNALNALAGDEIVKVGEPVPHNPAYSRKRDPEQVMLKALLAVATAKPVSKSRSVKLVKQA